MKTSIFILMSLLSSTSLMFGYIWRIKNSSKEDVTVTLTTQNASPLSLQVPSGKEVTQDVGTACVSKVGVMSITKPPLDIVDIVGQMRYQMFSRFLSGKLFESQVPDDGCKNYAIEIDYQKEKVTVTIPEQYFPASRDWPESVRIPAHTEEKEQVKPSLAIKFLS